MPSSAADVARKARRKRRMRRDAFLAGQRSVLELMASGAKLGEVLERIVRLIEAQDPGLLCSILLLDAAKGRLSHGAAPSLPAEYVRAIDGTAIGPTVGSCGASAYLGQPVYVEDIATHPNWDGWRELALPHGLRACWSIPIFSSDHKVLGTFAMYYRERRLPQERERQWIEAATRLASLAIQRALNEQAIVRAEARYRQILETTHEGVWMVDLDGATTYVNRRMADMLGATPEEMMGRNVTEFVVETSSADFAAQLTKRMQGPAGQYEVRLRRRDGGELWALVAASPLVGDDGVATGAVGMVADLTEQKRAVAARLQSEAQFRGMFEHAAIGMVLTSLDGRLVTSNRAYARMLGRTGDDLVGQSLVDAVHADDRQHALDLLGELVGQRHEACRAEVRFVRKSGRVVYGRLTLSLVREADGAPSFVIAMVEDVTDARRLEEEIRAGERLRKLIFDNVSDDVFFLAYEGDDRFRHVTANAMFYAHTGLTEREAVGRTLDELVPADRLERVLPYYRQAIAERRSVRFEMTAPFPTGVHVGEVAITPLCDPSGACTSIVGTVHDITERKVAEEKIGAQAALLDVAREAILVRGLDHVVRYWNAGATRTYGWTAAEAVGRDVRELLFRDADRPAFDDAMRRVLADGEWTGELHQVTKDGRPLVAECSWTLVRRGDAPPCVFAIDLDVSDRKRLEAQVALSQRMESLGTLAGGIAHDFNNVLAAILGSVSVARLQLPADDPVQRKLEVIEGAARRATDLVRQILTFSRGAQARRAITPIRPVVEEALKLLRATLPAMIELRTRFSPESFDVAVDPSQIHQVVMNLATNAVQAMGDSPGVLAVELEPVELTEPLSGVATRIGPGRYMRLRVADQGHGMDAATLARIFEPFFTTKPPGIGTGLGLSVVLGIVKGHGGALTVTSHPGEGTTFDLYFPAADPTRAPIHEAPPLPVEPGRGERVMFVDDEVAIVTLVTQFLEGLGYRVVGYTDPEEALEAVRSAPHGIDVLVTDYAMAGLSGLALAAEVRHDRADLPIVLVSGYPTPEVGDEARRLGVRAVLGKPDFLTELPRVLAMLLAPMRGAR